MDVHVRTAPTDGPRDHRENEEVEGLLACEAPPPCRPTEENCWQGEPPITSTMAPTGAVSRK
eukprot:2850578-Alexandrium_andersonii.AAC.1